MMSWSSFLVKFCKEEDGPTAVEYAMMLGLIIAVCVTAISTIGSNTNQSLSNPQLVNAMGSSS